MVYRPKENLRASPPASPLRTQQQPGRRHRGLRGPHRRGGTGRGRHARRGEAHSTAARVTAGAAGRTLLLLNGQQLALRRGPGGRPVTSLMAPATGGFSFIFITSFCQQASDVPAAALPYLGRGLDPNLFRVSALRQVERAGRLPVQGDVPRGQAGPRCPA